MKRNYESRNRLFLPRSRIRPVISLPRGRNFRPDASNSDVSRNRTVQIAIRDRDNLLFVGIAVDIVGLGRIARTIQEVGDHATFALHLNGAAAGERISFGREDVPNLLCHLNSVQHPRRLHSRGHVHCVPPNVVLRLSGAYHTGHNLRIGQNSHWQINNYWLCTLKEIWKINLSALSTLEDSRLTDNLFTEQRAKRRFVASNKLNSNGKFNHYWSSTFQDFWPKFILYLLK